MAMEDWTLQRAPNMAATNSVGGEMKAANKTIHRADFISIEAGIY